jgi:hypothetical protein
MFLTCNSQIILVSTSERRKPTTRANRDCCIPALRRFYMENATVNEHDIQSINTEKFWSRVRKNEGGCWLWLGGTHKGGYGSFRSNHKVIQAHWAGYALKHGIVPDGKILHHTCKNPACVNPDHLMVLTRREHSQQHPEGPCFKKSHCKNGHPLNEQTCYSRFRKDRGYIVRHCRICAAEAMMRRVQAIIQCADAKEGK